MLYVYLLVLIVIHLQFVIIVMIKTLDIIKMMKIDV